MWLGSLRESWESQSKLVVRAAPPYTRAGGGAPTQRGPAFVVHREVALNQRTAAAAMYGGEGASQFEGGFMPRCATSPSLPRRRPAGG
jgi:hypothetical protein